MLRIKTVLCMTFVVFELLSQVVNIDNTEVGGNVHSLKAMAGLTHVLCDYSQVRANSACTHTAVTCLLFPASSDVPPLHHCHNIVFYKNNIDAQALTFCRPSCCLLPHHLLLCLCVAPNRLRATLNLRKTFPSFAACTSTAKPSRAT